MQPIVHARRRDVPECGGEGTMAAFAPSVSASQERLWNPAHAIFPHVRPILSLGGQLRADFPLGARSPEVGRSNAADPPTTR